MLRFFIKVVLLRGFALPKVQSFIAVLVVVMMLQAVKSGDVGWQELGVAIEKHLKLFAAAYGPDDIRPKHHYALHLSYMLRAFGFLLATFTHERKHRMVKRYTHDRQNLRRFSLGTVE